jgi:hypothetical protein
MNPEGPSRPPVKLPKIYYINLDHRTDRNLMFQAEMAKLREACGESSAPEVVRVPAIKHQNGAIGCGMSHCKALEMFLATEDETAIIMEDDYKFADKMIPMLVEYLNGDEIPLNADILMLAANLRQHEYYHREFIRVKRAFTTSGYWLNRRTAIDLLALWNDATVLHEVSLRQPNPQFCIDVAWWPLMHHRIFLAMSPLMGQIGYQRPGWSDIEMKNVNYLV